MTSKLSAGQKAVILGIIVCLLMVMVFAVRVGLSNLAFFRAEKEVAVWNAEGNRPSLSHISQADESIRAALSLWADNPDYLSLAAQVHAWKGYSLAEEQNNFRLAKGYYTETILLLRRALKLRPAHAETWALLAEYNTLLGEKDDEWLRAKEKALELGGANVDLVNRMIAL